MPSSLIHSSAAKMQGTTAAASTAESYITTHEKIAQPIDTHNFIDNQFVPSKATQWIDLHDPATNGRAAFFPPPPTRPIGCDTDN
jgi:malonate-semialdehyde dehydrogenase (acetylating)/methylmalonate-semialdehyde dehydrogenase